jgi:Protein of unknown function (DUF2569)/GYF domain 2
MSRFWYYAEGTETRGPITFDQLVKVLSLLPTPKGVLVWREGFDDWTAAENVREIAVKLIRPPPLPLTPTRSPVATPREAVAEQEESDTDTVARYQRQFRKDKSVDQRSDDTVARYQKQFRETKPESKAQSEPAGIGGWLALLGFGLAVAPFKSLINIAKEWGELDTSLVQHFPVAMRGVLVIEIAYLLLWVCAAILFFKHSRKFPRFLIWLLIAAIFESLVAVVWLKLNLPSTANISSFFVPEVVAQMIVQVIAALLWIPYILKSKRVANTFVD